MTTFVEKLEELITEARNDITEYFKAELPSECAPADIDRKLELLQMELLRAYEQTVL